MGGFTSWANKYAPYVAVGTAVIFIGMMIFPLAVVAGFASMNSGGETQGTSSAGVSAEGCTVRLTKDQIYKEIDSNDKEPPPALIPVYQAAAQRFKLGPKGPSILASINKIETNFARSTLPGVRGGVNFAGAGGPMQFIGSTWDAYAVDGNKDGKKDRYNPIDAIFGAARYLKASGAPGDWQGAIFSYNHAGWYVADVVNGAQKYNILLGGPC